jgi:3-oxoadipate enol-lactonase
MSKAQVNGVQIAYDDTGSGPSVVLLHGYPFNRSLWRDQVQLLSQSQRVVTLDLRGHGESEVAPATMEAMARDVESLMQNLEIPRAVIGGLSMGGYVTLAFYKLFPERVHALVLADTRASADTSETKQTRVQQAERALKEGMAGITTDMMPKLLRAETLTERPDIVVRLREMMMSINPRGAAEALKAMATRDDQTNLLSSITVPTLIVVGRDDAITSVKDSELMHKAIRDSQLEVIEKSGHVSNLEQVEQFNRILREFLRY